MQKKFLIAAATYAGLGLAAGLYYRTLTQVRDFHGHTDLALAHTHLLALGMLTFLALAALEAQLGFAKTIAGKISYWTWHLGMVFTLGAMVVKGTLQVLGATYRSAMFAGIAGWGHILLGVAMVTLFVALLCPVRKSVQA